MLPPHLQVVCHKLVNLSGWQLAFLFVKNCDAILLATFIVANLVTTLRLATSVSCRPADCGEPINQPSFISGFSLGVGKAADCLMFSLIREVSDRPTYRIRIKENSHRE